MRDSSICLHRKSILAQTLIEYFVQKYQNQSLRVLRDSLQLDSVESPRSQSDLGIGRGGFIWQLGYVSVQKEVD